MQVLELDQEKDVGENYGRKEEKLDENEEREHALQKPEN